MRPDIDVDTGELRRCAGLIADGAARLRAGPDLLPSPVLAAGWATTEAADTLRTTAERRFAGLAAAVSSTGRQLIAAATDYEAADERAAGRLRRTGAP